MKAFLLTVVTFVFGFFVGFFIYKRPSPPVATTNQDTTIDEFRLKQTYKFINPLLECSGAIGTYKSLNPLKSKIDLLIAEQTKLGNISTASVYFRDLNNGPWFGINEHTLFTPASLIKVPVMMTYFKLAEHDPLLLSKKLKTSNEISPALQNVYFKPTSEVKTNTEYAVSDLIESMIIHSDNVAYKTLKDNLNPDQFNMIFRDFAIDIDKINSSKDENVLSIIDYSSFFRILFNASYLNKDMSEKALELLSATDFNQGLIAGLPPDTIVAHKFGERYYSKSSEKQLHDCGIVYKGARPYLLCIMTRGNNFDALAATIKSISATVYDHLSQQ